MLLIFCKSKRRQQSSQMRSSRQNNSSNSNNKNKALESWGNFDYTAYLNLSLKFLKALDLLVGQRFTPQASFKIGNVFKGRILMLLYLYPSFGAELTSSVDLRLKTSPKQKVQLMPPKHLLFSIQKYFFYWGNMLNGTYLQQVRLPLKASAFCA